MTINMDGKSSACERKKQMVSNITFTRRPSVIFCQELPGEFKEQVVEECGGDGYSYKYAPESTGSGDHAAVMWNENDFKGDEVKCTDSSIKEILERLKEERPDVDESWVPKRAAMVKLTSEKTRESFLAVSWHGPQQINQKNTLKPKVHKRNVKKHKLKVLHFLIRFLLKVCEKVELSSFIIGGDFNLNTTTFDLREYEGIWISRYELCTRDKEERGQTFVKYKDTFIVMVKNASDKPPLPVSSVEPLELKNSLLDHVPVVGDLKFLYKEVEKRSIKQDRGTNTEDQTTNENGILGLTPEKTPRGVGSEASGVPKKLDFEVASSSSSGQSSSASHDGYVTKKDFDRLMSLVDLLHKKIDRQTGEIAEIKSAMKRPDCPHRSVSPAQHAKPNSQTSKVLPSPHLDEGSDKESASEINKKERIKKE